MGCEDEFLPLPASVYSGLGDPSDLLDPSMAPGYSKRLILATVDELDPAAMTTIGLQVVYGFPGDWWNSLDDPADSQGYIVAWDPSPQGGLDRVLIVGASKRGLTYGVLDWLQSLESVTFTNSSASPTWSPDPSGGFDSACSAYDTTVANCDGTSPDSATCYTASAGGWDPVADVSWCPERAVNYPDIPTRLGFASLRSPSRSASEFLPNILRAGLGACAAGSESLWWDDAASSTGVLWCDRDDTAICHEVLVRLDSLVRGHFTHALDESWPHWNSGLTGLKVGGGCDSALLYDEVWGYLSAREVRLIPTIFGLETRAPEEPVGGELDNSWEASRWGEDGDFSLSEGLGINRKDFEVCEDASGDWFLMPVPETGYADAVADPCDYPDTGGTVGGPVQVVAALDMEPGSTLGASCAADWAVCDPSALGCWRYDEDGLTNFAATPQSACPSDPAIRVTIPISMPTHERLYVVGFRAQVDEPDSALRAKYVVSDTSGGTLANIDLELSATSPGSNQYHSAGPEDQHDTGDPSDNLDYQYFSFVFRAPPNDPTVYGGAYVQLVTKAGLNVWIDDLQVVELDGQLRNIDQDSFFFGVGPLPMDPSCFSISDNLPSAAPPTGDWSWQPFFEMVTTLTEPDVTDYRGSVQVSDPNVCGLEVGDILPVDYRTWTHSGLWPGLNDRQGTYTYSPGVFTADYWADSLSPDGQLSTLSSALGHGRPPAPEDPDDPLWDEFYLVSDLGGEVRGMGRAWPYLPVDNDQTLSSYYCGLQESVCNTMEVCTPSFTCADMLLHPEDPLFATCTCSSATKSLVPGRRHAGSLLIAGDMYTRFFNGAITQYQVPHAGYEGDSFLARQDMPPDAVYLAWWHFDQRKAGDTLNGHEFLVGMVEDFSDDLLDSMPASGWDVELARAIAALSAGSFSEVASETRADHQLAGAAHYGWGSDEQGAVTMVQAGHYFWQPEWALMDTWLLSDFPAYPGGDDTSEWTETGMTLGPQAGLSRPFRGRQLTVDDPVANWVSETVDVETAWVGQPTWVSCGFGWCGSWSEQWAQALVRFYAAIPDDSCQVEVEFLFHGATPGATPVVGAFNQPVNQTGWDQGGGYLAWSARADYELSGPAPGGTLEKVGVEIRFEDCAGLILDNPSLYQGLPWIDFPTEWSEQDLAVELDSTNQQDARTTICGDPTDGTCATSESFGAH